MLCSRHLFFQAGIVAVQDIGFLVRMEVHAVAHALFPLAAVSARAAPRPVAPSHIVEAVFPHVHEAVAVDVPLDKVLAAHAQAAAD